MQGLQSGRSPFEIYWRWRRVVSCCYGWLPAWLWGWWWWWLGYGHLDVCMLSMVTVLLQEIEILCGFLLPLICEWGSMDVCAWGEPLARLSMSILHTRSTPSRPHTDWYKLCCAYSCNFFVENINHNTTAQPHSYLQKQWYTCSLGSKTTLQILSIRKESYSWRDHWQLTKRESHLWSKVIIFHFAFQILCFLHFKCIMLILGVICM